MNADLWVSRMQAFRGPFGYRNSPFQTIPERTLTWAQFHVHAPCTVPPTIPTTNSYCPFSLPPASAWACRKWSWHSGLATRRRLCPSASAASVALMLWNWWSSLRRLVCHRWRSLRNTSKGGIATYSQLARRREAEAKRTRQLPACSVVETFACEGRTGGVRSKMYWQGAGAVAAHLHRERRSGGATQ